MRATGRLGLGLAGLFSIQLIGCTALGWWIGHDVDKKAQPKPVPSLQVASLGRGQSVELVLRDGSVVAGRFEGMEPVPSAQYRERWQQGLQTLAPATLVPGLGAARLRKKAGSEGNVTLLGLRPGQLSFREAGNASNGTLSLESVAELGVPGADRSTASPFHVSPTRAGFRSSTPWRSRPRTARASSFRWRTCARPPPGAATERSPARSSAPPSMP